MEKIKYQILNPIINKTKPYYDKNRKQLIIPTNKNYTYYLECSARQNDSTIQYYLLLGNSRFNENCKRCNTNMYGKCNISIKGELLEHVLYQIDIKNNIELIHIDSNKQYEAYKII